MTWTIAQAWAANERQRMAEKYGKSAPLVAGDLFVGDWTDQPDPDQDGEETGDRG